MTHAELLRRDAELAIREGGMYYSGEYLSRMATVAESLEAENAKLLTEFDKMDKWHSAELQAAMAENANLRKLIRDMNKWLWNGADCTECPFTAECDLNVAFESGLHAHVCIGWGEIHDRMRELGVDVP